MYFAGTVDAENMLHLACQHYMHKIIIGEVRVVLHGQSWTKHCSFQQILGVLAKHQPSKLQIFE